MPILKEITTRKHYGKINVLFSMRVLHSNKILTRLSSGSSANIKSVQTWKISIKQVPLGSLCSKCQKPTGYRGSTSLLKIISKSAVVQPIDFYGSTERERVKKISIS